MTDRRPLVWSWLGEIAYAEAWALQRRLAEERAAGRIEDTLLLLEHPPVYTLGRNTLAEHLPGGREALLRRGAAVFEVDRGGSVTFHGPGQLVAYPIVRLADLFPLPGRPGLGDVARYVRALEEAVLAMVGPLVPAARRPPYTGVWVGKDKLCAIGVKLTRGVTMHGLALNVTTDLGWFEAIVPCGISDGGVCSLASLGKDCGPPAALAPRLADALAGVLERRPEYRPVREVDRGADLTDDLPAAAAG